jgi:site-specific DNA recombinase
MPRTKAPRRAVVYTRISRDRTGTEAGVQRQEQECRAHVERNGWELIEVLADDDLSAYSGKTRPGYNRLLAMIKADGADVVVATHPDRLTRSPRELEDLIDVIEAAGVAVDTVNAGRWDLSTRSGRTTARLIGAVGRDESEAKSERLKAMHSAKARDGAFRGGIRHYGYRPDGGTSLDIVPAEAAILRECARRVLAGESANAIVLDLNRRGTPTVRGKSWRVQSLKRILTSWTVAGVREHHGEPVGEAQWEGILTRAERDRLARLLNDPDRTRKMPARVSLLAGIARCAHCSAKLRTGRRKSGARIYCCPPSTAGGCGGVQCFAGVDPDSDPNPDRGGLDDLITAAVLAALDTVELADTISATPADADPSAELDEIETELEALAADLGSRRISRREWMAAREPLERARDAARARLNASAIGAAVAPYMGRPGALAAAWPGLSLDQRRAIVSAVIDRVMVSRSTKRGPGFDSSRVFVEWRA